MNLPPLKIKEGYKKQFPSGPGERESTKEKWLKGTPTVMDGVS